jgi:hypothetical protein
MSLFKIGFSEAIQKLFTPQAKSSVSLFRHGTLEVKMYAPRKQDPQTPHTRDEVYIVAQGSGTYFYAGERQPFSPGDFLFALLASSTASKTSAMISSSGCSSMAPKAERKIAAR